MNTEARLKELGIVLPLPPKPVASYVPLVKAGNLVFVSGLVPQVEGRPMAMGHVGKDVSADQANAAAKQSALQALSLLHAHTLLDRVKRVVRVTGYVASAPGFADQPKVLNGASDVLLQVFGDAGRHARSAIGVSQLPLNSAIEVEFIFEVE
jgi:enamine deaminase RidA (YjgF/YER057c/UK114 family)